MTNSKHRTRQDRRGRIDTRINLTPMVDIMMLLVVAFMFCLTWSRPQILDLVMPTEADEYIPYCGGEIHDIFPTTFILAGNNTIYYYTGMCDYEDYTSLTKIGYDDVRTLLAKRNHEMMAQIKEIKEMKEKTQISLAEYTERLKDIKRDRNGQVVILKLTKDAVYKNLLDVLDEIQICDISRYAIVDITAGDEFLMMNYESQGELYTKFMQQ